MNALTDLNQFPINCEYQTNKTHQILLLKTIHFQYHTKLFSLLCITSHSFHYFTRCNQCWIWGNKKTDSHTDRDRETEAHTQTRKINKPTNQPIRHQNTESHIVHMSICMTNKSSTTENRAYAWCPVLYAFVWLTDWVSVGVFVITPIMPLC